MVRMLSSAGIALLFLSLGSTGCSSTVNQDACRAYVDHLNSLSCRAEQVEAESTCPADFDDSGAAPCTAYFECLTQAARCDGDTFVNDVSACTTCEVDG